MNAFLALQQSYGPGPGAAAAPAAFFGVIMLIWCVAITLGIAQFGMFIAALIQILSRQPMPNDAKILWCAVSWFVPVLGPILWWSIGSKQHPPAPQMRPPGPEL